MWAATMNSNKLRQRAKAGSWIVRDFGGFEESLPVSDCGAAWQLTTDI